MNNGTMLYRCPGPKTFEGVSCETIIVEAEDVEAALAEGWHRNWVEADQARKDAEAALAANEADLAANAKKLAAAGQGVGSGTAGGAPKLKAVHKGRGKYDVVDEAGNVLASGLTKDLAEAQAAAGG